MHRQPCAAFVSLLLSLFSLNYEDSFRAVACAAHASCSTIGEAEDAGSAPCGLCVCVCAYLAQTKAFTELHWRNFCQKNQKFLDTLAQGTGKTKARPDVAPWCPPPLLFPASLPLRFQVNSASLSPLLLLVRLGSKFVFNFNLIFILCIWPPLEETAHKFVQRFLFVMQTHTLTHRQNRMYVCVCVCTLNWFISIV